MSEQPRSVSEPEVQPRQDPTPKSGFYVLKTDGGIKAEQGKASGPAAIGVVLKDHKYRDVDEISKSIGLVRNHHVAEYKALIAGLEMARRHEIDRIRVFSDSALVVNAVNGDWNLEPEHLKDLCVKAGLLVKEFADIQLSWVPREMNVEADTLAGRALGRGIKPGTWTELKFDSGQAAGRFVRSDRSTITLEDKGAERSFELVDVRDARRMGRKRT